MSNNDEKEAAEAKQKLGIGKSLEERIRKLKDNHYQYATAGDVKMLIQELERLWEKEYDEMMEKRFNDY